MPGAGDDAASERRGPLQSHRLWRRPGHAVADRRPAGRPGRPADPVPPAPAAAAAVPGPPVTSLGPARTSQAPWGVAAPRGARSYGTELDGPAHGVELAPARDSSPGPARQG